MKTELLSAVVLLPLLATWLPTRATGQEIPQGELILTILFDNFSADDRMQTGWGFAVLLETPEHTVLFDTGADGEVLLENMRLMGKDPAAIEAVVISHAHGDHTGGMQALFGLGVRPKLYLLEAFPAEVGELAQAPMEVVLAAPGQEIVAGIRTTGLVGEAIPEQGLVLETRDGPLLLTGCAHPGVVEMAARSAEVAGGPVFGVLGGFHLGSATAEDVQAIISRFRTMGIRKAGPTHCSGPDAMASFQDAYGEDFLQMGVGRVLRFPLSG